MTARRTPGTTPRPRVADLVRNCDFGSTREALVYVEDGRAKAGRVVVRMTA